MTREEMAMVERVMKLETEIEATSEDHSECSPYWYYIIARNTMLAEFERREVAVGIEATSHAVKRVAVAIQIGAKLRLARWMQGGDWTVVVEHKDGSTEGLIGFRRRKYADRLISSLYLLALDRVAGF